MLVALGIVLSVKESTTLRRNLLPYVTGEKVPPRFINIEAYFRACDDRPWKCCIVGTTAHQYGPKLDDN